MEGGAADPAAQVSHRYLVPGAKSSETALKAECSQRVEAAVQEYTHTGKQPTDAMFDYLFAKLAEAPAGTARAGA